MRLLMELAPTKSWGRAMLAQEAVVPGEAASHGTQGHDKHHTQPKHPRGFTEQTVITAPGSLPGC